VEPLNLRLATDPAALATLRPSVRAWLERLELVEPDVAAIVAACWEVTSDAAESTSGDGNGQVVELTAALVGQEIVARCTGPAGWRVEDRPSRYVAALLVDDLAIERSADAVSVELRKSPSRGLRL